jgi:glycine betaine/proline transport system substrate-binding protein
MAAILGLALFSVPAAASDIVVGVPAWPSAEVTANVIGQLLDKEFDVEVAFEQLGTAEILEAIDRGEIQVHPEIWLPNLAADVDKFKEAGTLALSSLAVPASQNICVTSETARQVGIDEVADLTNPQIAKNFDTDGDGKGEMWIGAPTWSSTAIEKVRARSYGYDKTMTLLEAPESVAMAAVDVAVSLDRPIVFYCYSPHHIFGLHGVQVLGEPAHDPETWSIVAQDEDAEWLDKSSAGSGWDVSFFQVGYATSLASDRPEVAKFLSQIVMTPEDAAAMSYAVQVDRKAPSDVAADWIARNEHRIEGWLK